MFLDHNAVLAAMRAFYALLLAVVALAAAPAASASFADFLQNNPTYQFISEGVPGEQVLCRVGCTPRTSVRHVNSILHQHRACQRL